MNHYQNQRTVRDGKVLLYQRSDIKSKNWQCRIRVNGKYKVVSLKTENEAEAEIKAGEIYDDLRFKIKYDLPITDVLFGTLVDEYRAIISERANNKEVTVKYEQVTNGRLDALLKYIGRKTDVTQINQDKVDGYVAWRKDNNRSGDKMVIETLNTELGLLGSLFDLAIRKKYIQHGDKPLITRLKRKNRKEARRATFTIREYKKLMMFMSGWVGDDLERIEMRYYALVLANTGIRPGEEMRHLRWFDIVYGNDDDDYVRIPVLAGKRGERRVVAHSGVKKILEGWRAISPQAGDDDLIWITPAFEKQWAKMLDECGLRLDRKDKRRTLYSLRHYFITMKLQAGTEPYPLSKLCGTSVQMIETYYDESETEDFLEEVMKSKRTGDVLMAEDPGFLGLLETLEFKSA